MTVRVFWRRPRRALHLPDLDQYPVSTQVPYPSWLGPESLRARSTHYTHLESGLDERPGVGSPFPSWIGSEAIRARPTRYGSQQPGVLDERPTATVSLDIPIATDRHYRRQETRRRHQDLLHLEVAPLAASVHDFPLAAESIRRLETRRRRQVLLRLEVAPSAGNVIHFPFSVESLRRIETRRRHQTLLRQEVAPLAGSVHNFPLSAESIRRLETRRTLQGVGDPDFQEPSAASSAPVSAFTPLPRQGHAFSFERNRQVLLRLEVAPLGASVHDFPMFPDKHVSRRETRRQFVDVLPVLEQLDLAATHVFVRGPMQDDVYVWTNHKTGDMYLQGAVTDVIYVRSTMTDAVYVKTAHDDDDVYFRSEI